MRSWIATLALVALAAACSDEETQAQAASEGEPAGGTAASTVPPEPGTAPQRAAGEPLRFSPPEGWAEETPTSSMRKAQYRLPAPEGAPGDAELVVYFFGPQGGGSIEANLERWAGQFVQPDEVPPSERMQRGMRRVAGMDVTEVELSGTYVAETRPGSGERVREQGWRMLAAIVESDHGPYYLKLVGPEATVEHWESAFRGFVSTIE